MPKQDEFGVRYVTVKVRTRKGVDSFSEEVENALKNHKIKYPFSSALFPPFEEVEAVSEEMAYQYQMRTGE